VKRSLRGRLGLALGLTAALSVIVTALISFGLVGSFARANTLRDLDRHAQAVASEAESLDLRAQAIRRLLRASGDTIAVIGPRGAIVTDEPLARRVAQSVDLSGVLAGRSQSGTVRVGSTEYAYVALPTSGARVSGVFLARPTGLAAEIWRPVFIRVLLAGAAAVAVALGASTVIARRLTRPVQHLADATARLAGGNLDQPVPVEGDDEIADLARRFNAMASALTEARRREQEFLANVSHELRTPITAIRGYAEAISDGAVRGDAGRREAVQVIRDEAARLERLVQDVIDLARVGEKDFTLRTASVDLAETLREAARVHSAAAKAGGVALSSDAPAPLPCITDAGRVRQILSNLIENALRVTPSGGSIRLSGRLDGGGVVIEVADTGPGISPDDLPHVFERAYLHGASKGDRPVRTGLGLAIVRELATALGGRIDVTSEAGRGTTFRLRLSTSRDAHVAR
jgi:signal transduction histidine kinase